MSSESNDDSDASGRDFNDQFTPIDKEVIPSSVISGVIERSSRCVQRRGAIRRPDDVTPF